MRKKSYLALIILALLLVSCSRHPKGTGVSALLGWTPAEAMAVWAVDFRQTQDLKALAVYARQFLDAKGTSKDAQQVQKMVTELEATTGAKLEDLAAAVKPAALLYVLKSEDSPSIVGMVPIADKAKLTEILNNLQKKEPGKVQKVGEVDATVFQAPKAQPGYAIVDDHLFLFTHTAALEAALNTYRGRAPGLIKDAGVVAARKRMAAEEGAFFYCPLARVLGDLSEKKLLPGDTQTASSLKCLGYAAAMLGKDGSFDSFLQIDPKGGPLASALLAPAHSLAGTLDIVPGQMDIVLNLDLHYFMEVAKQLAALSPEGRGVAPMIASLPQRIGMTETELWEMLTGQVVVALESTSVIPQLGGSQQKATVLMMFGLKDTQKATQKLKSMPGHLDLKPDEDKVPHRIGPAAYCLIQKPEPYLVVALAPEADKLLSSATGGEQSLAKTALFKANPPDLKKPAPIFFYLDPQVAAKASGAESIPGLTQGYQNVYVESDGLRWAGQGAQFTAPAGLAIGAAILVPNFIRARGQGQVTACKSNEKNIATACEMWASDHQGHYPKKLSELTPQYLKVVPTCPSAGADTYSGSYKSADGKDEFTFSCSGHHHKQVGYPANYPMYNSTSGLITN